MIDILMKIRYSWVNVKLTQNISKIFDASNLMIGGLKQLKKNFSLHKGHIRLSHLKIGLSYLKINFI
jgi:hypothetical protein